jgi:hypothetical protein
MVTALRKKLRPHRYALAFLLLTFGSFFTLLFSLVLKMQPDGLYAGHVHVWGDWALHISMAHIFAYKNPSDWFAYHPYFAGGKLTYAFLTNMISGLLIRFGWPIVAAFAVPSILYSLILIAGMYALFYVVLGSKKGSVVATSLFFLSSGPGFLRFIPDFLQAPSWQLLFYPMRDYSRLENYEWLAGNFVSGMLMPQRAFLLGMSMTVWILTGFLYVLIHKDRLIRWQRELIMLLCGIAAGILPIAHMHSLIALVIITGCISLVSWKQWKILAWFVIPAGIVCSIFYFKFVAGGIQNPHFMQILIGWTAPKGWINWVRMWIDIWGFMIPAAVTGIFLALSKKKIPVAIKVFYLSFLAIFALGNIVLFQPVRWDNSKLFLWVYFGFCPVATICIQWLWRNKWVGKILAIVLFLSLSLTGFMELIRLPRVDQHTFQMINSDDMQLGLQVRQQTDPRAVFLTEPTHNHPVLMWGARSILLGYPTWAWNFGFEITERQNDIRVMYEGGPNAIPLLEKNKISYVVVGPGELFNLNANEAFYEQNFPLAFSNASTRIYDVRNTANFMSK